MITIHDVARAAGVSQPTVSRALRDQRGVSPATRKRIRDAARELGYVASQTGRALATRQTRKIGVISAELSNPFYPALLGPIQESLATHGYETVLFTDRGGGPIETNSLLDGSLDAVVLTTSEIDSPLPGELMRRGMPIALVNRTVDGVSADACVADNQIGADAVADLLVRLGHRRVGAILGPAGTSTGRDRGVGLTQGLAAHGITIDERHLTRGPFHARTGEVGFRRLMNYPDHPTAVFCGNDVIAFGALCAAATLGVQVPLEVTIVGFDDIAMASWPIIDLTTVSVDLAAMAHHATALLVSRLSDPLLQARTVVVPTTLTLRGSHARVR